MQRHMKLSARILSMALSVAMVATMMPSTVFAAEGDVPRGASSLGISSIGTIKSIDKLEDRFEPSTGEGAADHIYGLAVELNTPVEDLNLPDKLTAMVERSTTTEQETIPVTWNSDKEYVSDENGQFIYTAVLPEGHILADGVKLPQIYVYVGSKHARDGGAHAQITSQVSCKDFTKNESCLTKSGHSGTPCWSWDNSSKTLTLNGANISLSTDNGIRMPADGTINLADSSSNTVACKGGTNRGIYFFGSGAIQGTGTLTINSGEVGIYLDSDATALNISGGTININAASAAIEGTNVALNVTGGNLTAESRRTVIATKSIAISAGRVSARTTGSGCPFEVEPTTSGGVTSTGAAWNNKNKTAAVYEVVTVTAVAFNTLTANGTANTTDTTELTLTFDKDVTGLTADDITVTGATKGTLTKQSGTGVYKLAISAITVAEGANVNVAVAKTGFTFNPANKDVAVHKAAAFVPVTDISSVPSTATAGTPLTLSGTVAPTNATNKTIVWTVKSAGTTGATVSGSTLSTTAAGTVTVTATITNGLTASSNYTQDFSITVNTAFVPVTGITDVPTAATAGTPLTLSGTVAPTNATNKTIVWTVKSAGTTGATISGSTLSTTTAGTVTVTATITNGLTASSNYTQDFTITVSAAFVPVTGITGVPTAVTAGTPLTLSGTVAPTNATNKTIVWTVKSAGTTGATISGSTLSTIAAGTVTVTATITNGLTASSNYTQDFTITVNAGINKTALSDAIANAKSIMENTVISIQSGSDVSTSTYWVLPDIMSAAKAALSEAEAVLANPNATQAEIDNAAVKLNAKVNIDFKNAKKLGTKSSGGSSGGGSTPLPSGGSAGGVTTPGKTVIDNPVGNQGSTNALTEAVKNALAAGTANATAYTNFANYTALTKDGLKAVNDASAAAVKGKSIILSTRVQLDNKVGNAVVSRITVDPVKLTAVMPDKLGLGVWFNQKNDTQVTSVNTLFGRHFDNKLVTITFEQKTPLAVNMEFAAKPDLSGLNTKSLYFYSYDPVKNIYSRIWSPNYRVDINGYSHITAPLGGSIIITDRPLTSK